jgi:microcin C transport system permease protein
MGIYFLRRLLLAIPTFIGCTIVVFTIVQLAPGGPLEQQKRQLQAAAAEGGSAGGITSEGETTIPPKALEELKRYYGFDKPILERYVAWLGVWPREVDQYSVDLGKERRITGGLNIIVQRVNGELEIVDAADPSKRIDDWLVAEKTFDDGSPNIYVYKTKVSGILTGDFGNSYQYREPVIELIKDRLPVSIQFGVIGFILAYVVSMYMGIRKALEHRSKFDIFSSVGIFALNSMPGWALGAILLMFLATESFVDLLPLGGMQSGDYETLQMGSKIADRALHFILPIVAFSVTGIASLSMLMKNSLLENLGQDYVRTAFAKGLREKRVIWMHAMRNSIIPLAARAGFVITVFLGGSFLIEYVFNIEGIGKLSYMAILSRDYQIVFAFTVINVGTLLIGNIISDFVLALVDPRIRFK